MQASVSSIYEFESMCEPGCSVYVSEGPCERGTKESWCKVVVAVFLFMDLEEALMHVLHV